MIPVVRNLLAPSTPAKPPGQGMTEESFPLILAESCRLEQLVSHGQASPAGFWYDQPRDEWVALLRGAATLAFETEAGKETLDLVAGDCMTIPARLKHRVESVSRDAVWLALHFGSHA